MNRAVFSVVAICSLLAVSTACGADSNTSTEPTATTEPGRVEIRQGRFSRGGPLGDANFSAVLPDGWLFMDAPTAPVNGREEWPRGIIVKTGSQSAEIGYTIVAADEAELDTRDKNALEVVEIDGVTVSLSVPTDFSNPGAYHRLAAAFPAAPGDELRRFGIVFNGTGLRGELYDEARSIIESVRYAPPPPAPPEPPEPHVTPGTDWTRVVAHPKNDPDQHVFSVLAPPGWRFVPDLGYDSFVGSFTDGETTIAFDYGSLSSGPVSFDDHLRDPDYVPEHNFWLETVDGKPFVMFRSFTDERHERAYTGVTTSRIPGLPDLVVPDGSFSSTIYSCGGSFWARSIGEAEQELVLAILRTLRAESQPAACR